MLDFRVETFLKVCQTMNYTRAAKELNITQPAVSQHISYLERYYGTRIFTYQNKRLSLTPQGEFLRKTLEGMAHDANLLADHIVAMTTNQAMHVRIGLTLTAGPYVVAPALADYLTKHPQVQVDVVSGDTIELLAQLDAGDIDCAIVEGFFDKNQYAWDTFCAEPFICVCGADNPLAGKRATFEALQSQNLLVREKGSGTRAVLEHALAAQNLSIEGFTQVNEVESLSIIKIMAQRNLGISFMYRAAAQAHLADGTLKEITVSGAPMAHDIAFLRLKDSVFEPEFGLLFAGLKKAAKLIDKAK